MASSSLPRSPRRECRHFSLDEIKEATDDFDDSKVLGQGGEGKVYPGEIKLGWEKAKVAVKHLKPNSDEFEKEIETISKLQHPNLVSLLGYCDESGQKILVYELMEKGSLSSHVKQIKITSSSSTTIALSWLQRLDICIGAARGLQHLHLETEEYPKGIIHRDVKPDNILLDKNWVAKISDFGMFKASHVGQIQSTMFTNLKGTGGYFAPEYVFSRSITRKIDVYAFGVVLFQVLCLKMPFDRGPDQSYYPSDNEDLGIWAQENVDTRIEVEICYDSLKAFTAIIAKTLKIDPGKRPTMDEVVLDLEKARNCQLRAVRDSPVDEQSTWSHPNPPSRTRETGAEDGYNNAVVIDIGGGITKAGFAREGIPTAVFPSVVCRSHTHRTTYVGDSCASFRGKVTMSNPVMNGIVTYNSTVTMSNSVMNGMVTSWADYQIILDHILYNELRCSPGDMPPVLLTEPPLKYNATTSEKKEYRINRENMVDVMFEKFNVPALYIGIQPLLSLFAHGLTSGIVIESGESATHSVPIYDGYVLPHATTGLNLAGLGLTDRLMKILNDKGGYCFSKSRENYEIVRDVKEKLCYVALNYDESERTKENDKMSYTLPDGELITLGNECFQCPEALFNPSLAGIYDEQGVHNNTFDSINMCNEDIRDLLYGSMVVSGGSTLLPGFRLRMEKEMRKLAPFSTREIKILAKPWRKNSSWFGGCVFTSLSTFHKMWISRKEYEEYGAKVVHRKCF